MLRHLILAIALTATLVSPAMGQDEPACGLPDGTLRFIVPYPPGGGYDSISRILRPYLEEELGVSVLVDNVTGAGVLAATRAVAEAPRDGMTMAIMPGIDLALQGLLGPEGAPTLDAISVIIRLAAVRDVWLVATDGNIERVEDFWDDDRDGPVLIACSSLIDSRLNSAALAAHALGLPVTLVAGYPSRAELILSVLRGETDVAVLDFPSALASIEAGELRPVLAVSNGPVTDIPALRDLPYLAGPGGLAEQTPDAPGQTAAENVRLAEAVAGLASTGRLIIAPAGLDPTLLSCLRDAALSAITDPGFLADMDANHRDVSPLAGDIQDERLTASVAILSDYAEFLQRTVEQNR